MTRHETRSVFTPAERVLVGLGMLAVAGLLGFALVRTARRAEAPPPVAVTAAPEPASATTTDEHDHDHAAEATIPRMTARELRAAIDAGRALVIDVRDVESFTAGHIPGAFHIPLSFVESQTPYMPRDKTIVAYCT